jgi:hypothetical protein
MANRSRVAAGAVIAVLGVGCVTATAQQTFPANGFLFYGEASRAGGHALFSADINGGAITSFTVTARTGVVVSAIRHTARPLTVGRLVMNVRPSVLALRLPRGRLGSRIVLLRHGKIRVYLSRPSRAGRAIVLTASGLPAKVIHVDLVLERHGPLIHQAPSCQDFEIFHGRVTRAGAPSPATATLKQRCY